MIQSHHLNNKRKRLEPKETLCTFCQKEHSKNMDKNYFCPIFQLKDRTNLLVYRSVQFNKLHIGIPRCEGCQAIHDSSYFYGLTLSILITAILGGLFYLQYGIYVIFYLVFGPAFILVLGPQFFANIFTKQKNILNKKEGAKKDLLVIEMLRNGWSLTQPNA